MTQNDIWTLLARRLTGEATSEEIRQLEDKLTQDPALKDVAEKIIHTWHHTGKNDMQKALDAFAKIDVQIQSKKDSASAGPARVYQLSRLSWFKKYRIAVAAACLALAAVSVFLFINKGADKKEAAIALQNITTPEKTVRQITMTDGSKIWLNENSKLEYGDKYNDNMREVWLEGEAYFDVVKNEKKPFIIHTNAVNVKVLGTAFNVKSYPGDKTVETSLIRGSVEVSLKNNPAKVYILKPNQKLIVPIADSSAVSLSENSQKTDDAKLSTVREVKDEQANTVIAEISWTERKLAFYESSFEDLAVKLSKRYNVSFVFKDSRKKELEFSGVFYRQTLEEALYALSVAAQFRYQVKDSIVYIY